jgi:hypothetical protein
MHRRRSERAQNTHAEQYRLPPNPDSRLLLRVAQNFSEINSPVSYGAPTDPHIAHRSPGFFAFGTGFPSGSNGTGDPQASQINFVAVETVIVYPRILEVLSGFSGSLIRAFLLARTS